MPRIIQQLTGICSSGDPACQAAAFAAITAIIRSFPSQMRSHVDKVETACLQGLDSVHFSVVEAAATCLVTLPQCGGSSATYSQANPSEVWTVLVNKILLTGEKLLDCIVEDETFFTLSNPNISITSTATSKNNTKTEGNKNKNKNKNNKNNNNNDNENDNDNDNSNSNSNISSNSHSTSRLLFPSYEEMVQQTKEQLSGSSKSKAGSNVSNPSLNASFSASTPLSEKSKIMDGSTNSSTASALILRRFKSTTLCLSLLLNNPVHFAATIPIKRIINLVLRATSISQQQLVSGEMVLCCVISCYLGFVLILLLFYF